jgi:HD-like signal output (HDOD) protein
MSPELSQKLAAAVDGMPAFPKSVQAILDLTRDVNCTPKDLVQVIDKDPVVTVKILKIVNSAYYSLPKQVTSINHAVVFLGFNTIKNLALSIAAIGMLPKSNEAGFDVQEYLLHSLATANIAKRLATDLGGVDPMDCFIAGLLHARRIQEGAGAQPSRRALPPRGIAANDRRGPRRCRRHAG